MLTPRNKRWGRLPVKRYEASEIRCNLLNLKHGIFCRIALVGSTRSGGGGGLMMTAWRENRKVNKTWGPSIPHCTHLKPNPEQITEMSVVVSRSVTYAQYTRHVRLKCAIKRAEVGIQCNLHCFGTVYLDVHIECWYKWDNCVHRMTWHIPIYALHVSCIFCTISKPSIDCANCISVFTRGMFYPVVIEGQLSVAVT